MNIFYWILLQLWINSFLVRLQFRLKHQLLDCDEMPRVPLRINFTSFSATIRSTCERVQYLMTKHLN